MFKGRIKSNHPFASKKFDENKVKTTDFIKLSSIKLGLEFIAEEEKAFLMLWGVVTLNWLCSRMQNTGQNNNVKKRKRK